jgi:hypothetical protein
MNIMENSESTPRPEQQRKITDFCPDIKSFQTEQGSIYEKLSDGTFRRHKYDGTENEPMEWTMFTDKEGDKDLQMAKVKLGMSKITGKQIFFMIMEFDENGNGKKMISSRDEVLDVNDDFDLLAFETDGKNDPEMILQTPIIFTPKIGYSVFEISQNGGEYHHGDLVSNIEFKEN